MAKATKRIKGLARKQLLSTLVRDFLETSSDSDDDIYQLAAQDSDSDDEAIYEKIVEAYGKEPVVPNDYLTSTVSKYSEQEFYENFRISKDLYEKLVRKYEDSTAYKSLRAYRRLSAELHIAIFLWFAGHEGCRFRQVSKRFNLPSSSVSRVVGRITTFLHGLSEEAIRWPRAEEMQENANCFERQFGFSKAMGCIDVIYLTIESPTKNAKEYTNAKGDVTLCVQAVCDAQKRFINTFSNCPGSRLPSFVLHSSPMYANIASLCDDYYLLGPSSYPCSDWILTPFKNIDQLESDQIYFNQQHLRAYDTIRQAFSALKQRFQQLKDCKLKGKQKLCKFIEACCVLHNLSIGDDFEISNMIDDDGYLENVEATEPDINDETRMLICDKLWQNRNNFSGQVYAEEPHLPNDYLTISVSEYSTHDFLQNFRISKDLYEKLVQRYENSAAYKSLRPYRRLPADLHITIFLWFAGREGCRFRQVAKRFNLPSSSICRVVGRITAFIHSLSKKLISWPTPEKRHESASCFEKQFGFGKAMGCIDVTHLTIDSPTKNIKEYTNSKGDITLCMQAVCDAQKRFINTFISCPGSTQPNDVLHTSPIYANIATLCEDYYLLGPSSYPCSDWILTPFKETDELNSDQMYFNQQHLRAHDTIRQAFSALKQRFQQLKYCKMKGQRLCEFIEACCVLHNLSIGDDLEISNMVDDDGYIDKVEATEPDINDENRTLICDELWRKRNNFS